MTDNSIYFETSNLNGTVVNINIKIITKMKTMKIWRMKSRQFL
jgi:hypothetical protein